MNQPRILIADDDAAFTQALAVRLKEQGYEVLAVTDSYNALAQTVSQKPDVLILDVHMPAGTGFTVQERIQKIPELASVPVIYVTGDKSEEAKQNARVSGAFAIVNKPFEFEALLNSIQAALKANAA